MRSRRRWGNNSIYFAEHGQRPLANKKACASTNQSMRRQRQISKIRRWFERVYRPYNKNKPTEPRFDYYWASVHGLQTTAMMAHTFILDRTQFIDVGCGTSQVIRRIVRAICRRNHALNRDTLVNVFGLDLTPAAIKIATAKWSKLQADYPRETVVLTADYRVGDAIDLKQVDLTRTCLGTDKADIIFLSDLFGFLTQQEKDFLISGLRTKIQDQGAVPRRHLEIVHEAIKLINERKKRERIASGEVVIIHEPVDIDKESELIQLVISELRGPNLTLDEIKKLYSLIFGLDKRVGYLFLIEPETPHFPPMHPYLARVHANELYPLVDTATRLSRLYTMIEMGGFYRLDLFDQSFQSVDGNITFPLMTCSLFIPVTVR